VHLNVRFLRPFQQLGDFFKSGFLVFGKALVRIIDGRIEVLRLQRLPRIECTEALISGGKRS
jgi:hypothetical protein